VLIKRVMLNLVEKNRVYYMSYLYSKEADFRV